MASARVARGRLTQELAAAYFRERLHSAAKSRAASLPGVDIYDMPGLAPEVKATAGQDFTGALKQARANASLDEIPFVIYRPAGFGPARIGEWVVAFDFATAVNLLRKAGYGE